VFASEVTMGSAKAFILGSAASMVATILTYPLQVVQTKSRVYKNIYLSGEYNKSYFQLLLIYSFIKNQMKLLSP